MEMSALNRMVQSSASAVLALGVVLACAAPVLGQTKPKPAAKSEASVSTATVLYAWPNPVTLGQPVTLYAAVSSSSGSPAGTVNFQYMGNTLASQTLSSGSATYTVYTSGLSAGTYTLTASYPATSSYGASTSQPVQVVINSASGSGTSSTQTVLTSPSATLVPPSTATIIATVSRTAGGAAPSGNVTFSWSGITLAVLALNAQGVATFSTPTGGLALGQYPIVATYGGDANNNGSTSSPLVITLAQSQPTGPTQGTPYSVAVNVNPLADRHTISPLIYGQNFPTSAAYIQATGTTLVRWGGNDSSTYNWTNGASNGNAYNWWDNYPFTGAASQKGSLYTGSSQSFVNSVAAAGGSPLIAISELPWASKDTESYSFSIAKYGVQCATDPGNPDIGDGIETDCETQMLGNNVYDAYTPLLDQPGNDDPYGSVYRNQWVAALAQNFGSAPHLYSIDNEPELWSFNHRDVHPAYTTYQELRDVLVTEAANVKQWDPQAIVLGPSSSTWFFYWNVVNSTDKALYANIDYGPWLLNEVYWADQTSGKRSLDWWDLHAYPTGNITSSTTIAQAQTMAMQVTRDFWDPTFLSQDPDINQPLVTSLQPNPTIALRLPRMRAMINSIYPGTQLSISEWNAALAGEMDFSTALADADIYGIFGRERVYAAARWTAPYTTEPAYNTLLLYRNYDGAGHAFGTTSVQATNNASPNTFSSYAALNAAGTQMTVMLINKDPNDPAQVSLNLGAFYPSSINTYTLSQANPNNIVSAVGSSATNFTLAPWSATLLVLNGTMSKSPTVEWDLNPQATMVPAGGSAVLYPQLLSGSGSITLSNPQVLLSNPSNNSGVSFAINTAQVSNSQWGAITVTAGSTPGFYQYQVTGTDNAGTQQTQSGWVIVQNPAATITKGGDNQSATRGSTLTLYAQLNPGQSGGTAAGAGIFFTTNAGTLSAREVTTNSAGVAQVNLTLPSYATTVTVKAEGQYALGHPVVTFTETSQ
jgi:hypothetical protein